MAVLEVKVCVNGVVCRRLEDDRKMHLAVSLAQKRLHANIVLQGDS